MKIRPLKLKDKENWIKLAKDADNRNSEWAIQKFKSYVATKKRKKIIVYENNNKLIGFIGLKGEDIKENVPKTFNEDYVLITWIAVLPDFRKLGLGSKLLAKCERYARKLGKRGIWLGCRDKVIPFYQKNGYKQKGTFINEKGKEENLMVKELR